jgi:pimeloyl-ACP methyl ester carboxylesterase
MLVWWQQIAYFAPHYTVLAMDHRGFGRSRCAPEHVHARHFVGDLEVVLDDAGMEQVSLVCQSMGGWTGMLFTLAHPERVRCLILSGTPGGVHTPRIVQNLTQYAQRQRMIREGHSPAQKWETGLSGFAPDFHIREPARTFLYWQLGSLNPRGNITVGLLDVGITSDCLTGYTTPTVLIAGEQDQAFDFEALREVAGCIPGAVFPVLSGVGHSPYFEAPEAFNRIVEGFLAEHH